jgi:hypothetical protein
MLSGREMAAVSSRTNEPVGAVDWSNRRRGLVAGVVVAAAWLVGANAAVASRWTVEPTPPIGGYLSAVSCSSARACTAVGPSLALRSHGSAWSTQRTAKPLASTGRHFNGVSCPSATACFAVGRLVDRTAAPVALAERWNGSRWSVQPVPTPGGRSYPSFLTAVSCTSATACTAVGSYAGFNSDDTGHDSPLIERWNGSSWSIQKTGAPRGFGAYLTGVSCTARTLCTAVGEDYTDPLGQLYPIALRWTGRGWSLSQSAYQARLTAVSCTSATACAWVGESYVLGDYGPGYPLLGGWDGMHWTEGGTIAVPNPALNTALNAVSCTAANACTAVGGQGIALAWNGSVWSPQQTPTALRLLGVSCTSPTACTAVGPGVVERLS